MSKLYVVPTPIGNLSDMSFRAIEVLKSVDVVLAEDTRVSKRLLDYYSIDTRMQSYHQHNEHQLTEQIVRDIKNGTTHAMITDAGTPGISDPGYLLISKAIESEIGVEVLPGPTAFIPALVGSGIPCDRFYFEGFLPHKKGKQTKLEQLAGREYTTVFYESPHRILKTLTQLKVYVGSERKISLSREISKKFEENIRGSIQEVIIELENREKVLGEFVVVMAGK